MCLTFYLWMRSLRDDKSAWIGALCGVAYFYMVAAWGGYIFVLNMVGVHAAMLVGMGRFTTKVYTSYSLFYSVGTMLAIQIPVVGWAPLKSLEQLGPCAVFLGFQVLQFCEIIRRRRNLDRRAAWKLRLQVVGVGLAIVIAIIVTVTPKGYFGPISSRVRGLFVQHTKTGNPLVDSVAEHQPASSRAYFQYLHHVCSFAPLGYVLVMGHLSDSSSFLITWGTAAYFFSHKMVRLILLTAPIGTSLAGIAVGRIFAWSIKQWWEPEDPVVQAESLENSQKAAAAAKKKGGKAKKGSTKGSSNEPNGLEAFSSLKSTMDGALGSKEGLVMRRAASFVILCFGAFLGIGFTGYCWRLSQDLSNPTIIVKVG
jgi:dolichyl-diphosphooligosaccharide---protein glycosyltransferase